MWELFVSLEILDSLGKSLFSSFFSGESQDSLSLGLLLFLIDHFNIYDFSLLQVLPLAISLSRLTCQSFMTVELANDRLCNDLVPLDSSHSLDPPLCLIILGPYHPLINHHVAISVESHRLRLIQGKHACDPLAVGSLRTHLELRESRWRVRQVRQVRWLLEGKYTHPTHHVTHKHRVVENFDILDVGMLGNRLNQLHLECGAWHGLH